MEQSKQYMRVIKQVIIEGHECFKGGLGIFYNKEAYPAVIIWNDDVKTTAKRALEDANDTTWQARFNMTAYFGLAGSDVTKDDNYIGLTA